MPTINTSTPIEEVQKRVIGFLKDQLGSGVRVTAVSPTRRTDMPAAVVSLGGGSNSAWVGEGEGGVISSGSPVAGAKTFVYEPLARIECWERDRAQLCHNLMSKVQFAFETKRSTLIASGMVLQKVEGMTDVAFSDSLLNAYRGAVFVRLRADIQYT